MAERNVHMEDLMPLISESLAAGRSIRFSPKGISMLPMLRQGRDTVTLSAVEGTLRKYDIPLYRRDTGAYVLHRVVVVEETYTCIGDNQFALETGIRPDQIIGVVTAFTRKGKDYTVKDGRYRLYCVLWHWSRPARLFYIRVRRKLGRIRRSLFPRKESDRS